MEVGGWGGRNLAVASARFLGQNMGGLIACYCIFDRDYHIQDELDKRQKDAKGRGIELHIWQLKKLENYLLCAAAIHRAIKK